MTVSTTVKINLGLSILRRREDGYHDIETLFMPFSGIGDSLTIEPSDRGSSIEIIGGDWDPKTDLSWRAYQLLKERYKLPDACIRLEKHAPVGAGLGGGSADAAFTLKTLNKLFNLGISTGKLAEYASELGSDCAFFIYDSPMFGEGRGEILTPFEIDLSGYEIRLEIPKGVSVSTKEAYSNVVPRDKCPKMALREALALPAKRWRDCLVNDFETSVFAFHPEIEKLKNAFYSDGAVYAAMSGSGSAVFGLFEKQAE